MRIQAASEGEEAIARYTQGAAIKNQKDETLNQADGHFHTSFSLRELDSFVTGFS